MQRKNENFGEILRAFLPMQVVLSGSLSVAGVSPLREVLSAAPVEFWYWAVLLSFVWVVWTASMILGRASPIYLAFAVAAFLFNGGRAFAFAATSEDLPPFAPGLEVTDESEALFAALVMLHAIHLGVLVYRAKPTLLRTARTIGQADNDGITRFVGAAMMALSAVPAAVVLWKSGAVVIESGYMGLYQGEAATSYNALIDRVAGFFIPGCIFVLAAARPRSFAQRAAMAAIVVHSGALFFLGFRGWAILPLVSAAIVWNYRFRRIRQGWVVGIAALLLLVVFPLVPLVRETTGADRYSVENLRGAYNTLENPAKAMFLSMGATSRTVAFTQKLVPNHEAWRLGGTYIDALARVLPNVFGGLHPAAAEGSLGQWITWRAFPEIAARGGGIGFSFIAEAYLNFGWWGLLPVGFLIGYLLGWMGYVAQLGALPLGFVGSFLGSFLFFVRSDSAIWVRALFWYALAPVAVVLLVRAYLKAYRNPVGKTRHVDRVRT